MTNSVRAYRISAAESATHIGLLLSVYDALAEDMRLAGESAAQGDIAVRCRHSQHALRLLGHLESWVLFLDDDAALQQSLTCFYKYLRSEILRHQAPVCAKGFADLAMVICETRGAWQRKQNQATSVVRIPVAEVVSPERGEEGSNSRLCWSA